ncbi:MAG: hypothetical protein WC231_02185 [Dehalococcoidales bacterium]|jgi:hypothetical protein|nr:hypothetical protein [Dehalococcoidales bacterium]MDX9985922.1 hypothetical protein [Dehalococcoidales bacterium]
MKKLLSASKGRKADDADLDGLRKHRVLQIRAQLILEKVLLNRLNGGYDTAEL